MVYYPPEKQFDIDRIVNQKDDGSGLKVIQKKRRKRTLFKKTIIVFIVFVFLFGGYMIYKTNSAFDKITGEQNSIVKSFIKMLPFGDNFFQILPIEEETSVIDKLKNGELDRLNVLILGIRGADDPNGGLLSDSIMIILV